MNNQAYLTHLLTHQIILCISFVAKKTPIGYVTPNNSLFFRMQKRITRAIEKAMIALDLILVY